MIDHNAAAEAAYEEALAALTWAVECDTTARMAQAQRDAQIVASIATGVSQVRTAARFGLSMQRVAAIRRRTERLARDAERAGWEPVAAPERELEAVA